MLGTGPVEIMPRGLPPPTDPAPLRSDRDLPPSDCLNKRPPDLHGR